MMMLILYAVLTVGFSGYMLGWSGETDPVRVVTTAAAVAILWPILAAVYILVEVVELIRGEMEDEK